MASTAPLARRAEFDANSLLMGSWLRRPRFCSRVCVLLVGALVLATVIHLSLLAQMDLDVAAVFFQALALSSLLSLVPLAVLWLLDRRERRSVWLFAAAFLWGGLIATGLALPFNSIVFRAIDQWVSHSPDIIALLGPQAGRLLAAPLAAPIVEEILKALGVVVMFWLLRGEHSGVREGIVYGALVGVGFNWYEAALYVAQDYAQYGVPSYGLQLGGRYALFGFGGHAMFTGIFGAFYGLALQTRRRWLRLLAPVTGLVLAMAAHTTFNVLPLVLTLIGIVDEESAPQDEVAADVGFVDVLAFRSLIDAVLLLPFVLAAALALWRSGVRERRVICQELAAEPATIVTPREYSLILDDHGLWTRRIDPTRAHASAALVNAQNELGFCKRRVREHGNDPEADRVAAGWREDIRRLRVLIPAQSHI